MKTLGLILGAILLLIAMAIRCVPADASQDLAYTWQLPPGVSPPAIPPDNAMTASRISLGKQLFYDPILSVDSSISCGSCHQADKGFADDQPISTGVKGRLGFRNAPTLTQVAYSPYFFAEGGSPTLEMQVLGPIDDHNEFGFNAADLYLRIKEHPHYQRLALEAYGRPLDLFVITRAIAAFERTLVSSNSPFDNYFYLGDRSALSPAQLRGWELFQSERTQCATCHAGFTFSTYEFANVGLKDYADEGLTRRTMNQEDIGKFKIPTLRNVALTAPYFHDGSVATLEEVIAHFNRGGTGHANQSPLIQPLGLSDQEQADLQEFLLALTDSTMIGNPDFRP